ncbi:hypothetical protein [Arthrobacter methylotrophus]|uniref:Uncharacterized protein n=1 Tax=Arthrobacter methylotrophus TaxID=121291 RepID=A0ABV5UMU4_9MICC
MAGATVPLPELAPAGNGPGSSLHPTHGPSFFSAGNAQIAAKVAPCPKKS